MERQLHHRRKIRWNGRERDRPFLNDSNESFMVRRLLNFSFVNISNGLGQSQFSVFGHKAQRKLTLTRDVLLLAD